MPEVDEPGKRDGDGRRFTGKTTGPPISTLVLVELCGKIKESREVVHPSRRLAVMSIYVE